MASSSSQSRFPAILSPSVSVVTSGCPLDADQSAALTSSGFALPSSLAKAVSKRQDEFRAGRYCALQALKALGCAGAGHLAIAQDHSPEWPRLFVGSIAHSQGLAAAAVAHAADFASVGIDLEPLMSEKRAASVRHMIVNSQDEAALSTLAQWVECDRVTLCFSAKEAIYKCLRPLCGQYFGFEDASLYEITEAPGASESAESAESAESEEGSAGDENGADSVNRSSRPTRGVFRFHLNKDIGTNGRGIQEFKAGWRGEGRFARRGGWIFSAMEIAAL